MCCVALPYLFDLLSSFFLPSHLIKICLCFLHEALIFLRKSDYLGCAVLLCLICLTFFLASSFLLISLKYAFVFDLIEVCVCVLCAGDDEQQGEAAHGEGNSAL